MENPAPDIIPLSRFRALGARSSGRRRLDALISAKDAPAQIAALSVQELFTLIHDVGFADCQELIEFATPEQIRGCLDIDCWDRDSIQWEATLPWLAALIDCGFEKVGLVWPKLDNEFAALVIQRGALVYDLSMGEELPDEEERAYFSTPDTFFTVVLTAEREDEQILVRRLIEDLYRADGHEARRVLLSARSELPSYLQEMSYRWRSGRLADLGYVEFHEALEVFRPLEPGSVSLDERTMDAAPVAAPGDEASTAGHLPAPILEQVIGRSFLAKVLGGISNAETADRLEASILYLVNRVLSAARVSPGDAEAISVGASHAAATLALGLEYLSEGNEKIARQYLENVALSRLHRVGYTLTLRLARSAKALAPRSLSAGEPVPSVLSALLGPRPFYACALDDGSSPDVRPFESRVDLARVAAFLHSLTLRLAIAESLDANLSAHAYRPDGPALDDHGRTAMLHHLQSGDLQAVPFTAQGLVGGRSEMLAALADEGQQAGVARVFSALLQGHGVAEQTGLAALLSRWAEELRETISSLQGPDVDTRYIGGVLIR